MKKSYLILLFSFVIMFLFNSVDVYGAGYDVNEFTVYVGDGNQTSPDISCKNAAWVDDRNGDPNIYAKVLFNGIDFLVGKSSSAWKPAVDVNIVVWVTKQINMIINE